MCLGVTRDITFPANNTTANFTWVKIIALLQQHHVSIQTGLIYYNKTPTKFCFLGRVADREAGMVFRIRI
jgi:hypothetical protein